MTTTTPFEPPPSQPINITIGDSNQTVSVELFERFLQTKRTVILGNGCYGYVFEHPTDPSKVVKVCWNSPKYLKYACWAMAQTDNPHVPRIFDIRVFENHGNIGTYGQFKKLVLVVMERLEESNIDQFIALKHSIYGDTTPRDVPVSHTKVQDIWQYVKSISPYDDLHGGNVMARNGTPVLTDPIAG